MALLHQGDQFPSLKVPVLDGAPVTVPDMFAGRYGVVLFGRGGSCRSCVEQLRAFQRSTARFEKNRIAVVAWSADDETQTALLVSKYGLTFPIGYGADPAAVSEATGAFVSVDPPQLQSTAFVLDPSGRVLLSLYSCGAFGQLLPDDVIELVREDGQGLR
ncbi:redoxin domain-containing protein [Microbacterium sp. NPDC089318]